MRWLAMAAVLTICVGVYALAGQALAKGLVPILEVLYPVVDSHHRITRLDVVRNASDLQYRMEVSIARPIVLGGHVTMPDPRALATVATPVASFLIAPTVLILACFLIPSQSWPSAIRRVGFAVLAIPILWVLDAPFVFAGYVWSIHRDIHAPDSSSLLLAWHVFLTEGGRPFIGLLGALTICSPLSFTGKSLTTLEVS